MNRTCSVETDATWRTLRHLPAPAAFSDRGHGRLARQVWRTEGQMVLSKALSGSTKALAGPTRTLRVSLK